MNAQLLTLMGPALLTAPLLGQAFDATSSMTLSTSANGGVFSYSSYRVRPGVTVRYIGRNPVRIECSGSVRIEGTVSASGVGNQPGPSGPGPGSGSHGQFGCNQPTSPTSGQNLSNVEAVPLVLHAGGNGGDLANWWQDPWNGNCFYFGTTSGGVGGGVLRIMADGPISIAGRVEAVGTGSPTLLGPGAGAGGAVLLRSYRRIDVAGTVDTAAPFTYPGVVVLDVYGRQPTITGTVSPAPRVRQLPLVREQTPPALGGLWTVRHMADVGDLAFLAVSPAPASVPTSYGLLELDLSMASTVATVRTTAGDGYGDAMVRVPNLVSLSGVTFYVQSLNWQTAHRPYYTNMFSTTVR